jgi:hypothetical protein
VSFVAAEVAVNPVKATSGATTVPDPPGHPAPVTSPGWHKMNRTDPVGASAPGAFVSVAVSVTAVPGTMLPVGFAEVAKPGVALLMVIWAAPADAPLSPED